jgi:hypothetical protein
MIGFAPIFWTSQPVATVGEIIANGGVLLLFPLADPINILHHN